MPWVFKTEPGECSIDDIGVAGAAGVIWEGVRNYQARNFLRDQVTVGDLVLIHHSSCAEIGVAGVAKISAAAFADPSQFQPQSQYFDPKASAEKFAWFAVKVSLVEKFSKVLTLAELRACPGLAELALVKKGNRLSVMPATNQQFDLVLFLTKT
ncbi:EVE domain-containing protein [Rheinheimera riviphila]|uniref:EVE domain-containing protein n=1 Tax=Rheinheimera riviphila TaxID=1834037 RepID=A0A437QZH4_9GAMM|nr:EVE domain-containing protein [Rheinheimera riviphila]RVU39918.1 EVE domain-containing protein [Rheinheimera riviphila]